MGRRFHTFLLVFTGALGIGLFVVGFFVLPSPDTLRINIPLVRRNYLPLAGEREVPPPPEPDPSVTISFVGDIMLSRSVERTIVEKGLGWPFAKLGDIFSGSDIVVGNLEGTVRATRNLEVTNQMVFDTTPDNLQMLKAAGFTHLSLANNHADDYGNQVTVDSRTYVEEYGMTPFGDPLAGENYIARENINGIALSFIGFHAFGQEVDGILEAIRREDDQDRFVIVYPHWGPEYIETAPSAETYPAQLFVNAGADMIVGAHPHVIQNVEVVGDVPVIYSLGNFLFDQDFSLETKRGLTMQATITPEAIDIAFLPVHIVGRQTYPMTAEESQQVFDEFSLDDGTLHIVRE